MRKSRGTRGGARWLGVGLMLGAGGGGCLDWDGQLQQAGSVALALEPSSVTGSVTQPADVNGVGRVEIQRVGDDAKPTGEVTSTLTQDELGHYSTELSYSGAVHLVSTGVCYATGGSAECKLEGYAEVGPGAAQANLSFVTHITAERVRQLMADKQSLKDAQQRAERELREQLPLAGDLETLSPAQALSLESAAYPAGYLLAFTSAVHGAGQRLHMPEQEYLDALQQELADDGVISDTLRTPFVETQFGLDTPKGREDLAKQLGTKHWNGDVPDVRLALDEDGDRIASAQDNCRYVANPDQTPQRDICMESQRERPGFGTGGWSTSGETALVAVDADHDGDMDLINASYPNGRVELNDGKGTFEARVFAAPFSENDSRFYPDSELVGELTGDDYPDIIYSFRESVTYRASLQLIAGRGDGTFDAPREIWSAQGDKNKTPTLSIRGLADMNEDGRLDVIGTQSGDDKKSYRIHVLLNRPNGPWEDQVVQSAVQDRTTRRPFIYPHKSLEVGDWNGDGHSDVILLAGADAGAASNIHLFAGDGHGKLASPRQLDVGDGCTSALEAGDWDADGKLDLALVDAHATQLQLVFGEGDGAFTGAVQSDIPQHPQDNDEPSDDGCPGTMYMQGAMHRGHYTGAKEDDVAVLGAVFISENRATPRVRPLHSRSFSRDSGYPNDLPNADFNGDGYTDIAGSYLDLLLINPSD